MLLQLNDEMLKDDLGVASLLHRTRILTSIKKLS